MLPVFEFGSWRPWSVWVGWLLLCVPCFGLALLWLVKAQHGIAQVVKPVHTHPPTQTSSGRVAWSPMQTGLVGVVYQAGGGMALMQVVGQAAKWYAVGDCVADGVCLQAIRLQSVVLRSAQGEVVLSLPAVNGGA